MQEILYVLRPNSVGLSCQFDIVGRIWWWWWWSTFSNWTNSFL